jgi:hypothetical protein
MLNVVTIRSHGSIDLAIFDPRFLCARMLGRAS